MPTKDPQFSARADAVDRLPGRADVSGAGWRLCVAPMIDVTDRHTRYLHRLIAPRARVYTEMITTGALLHGDLARHLDFNAPECPVALQLGGSAPADLAYGAKLGERWGYDEINLNCGCPAERVQRGAFGACLMAEPALVADCVKAMQDAVGIPVTVKHRRGLDYDTGYGFVRDFVGALYDAGCRVFIVHARNAVLKGLSPKDNRDVPPLRYDDAARLKADFPDAVIVLNGGLTTVAACVKALETFDGVMLGRAAWHDPAVLGLLSDVLWPGLERIGEAELIETFTAYAADQRAQGVPLHIIVRGLLGLFSGRKGARLWRQQLSDAKLLKNSQATLIANAWRGLGSISV